MPVRMKTGSEIMITFENIGRFENVTYQYTPDEIRNILIDFDMKFQSLRNQFLEESGRLYLATYEQLEGVCKS